MNEEYHKKCMKKKSKDRDGVILVGKKHSYMLNSREKSKVFVDKLLDF